MAQPAPEALLQISERADRFFSKVRWSTQGAQRSEFSRLTILRWALEEAAFFDACGMNLDLFEFTPQAMPLRQIDACTNVALKAQAVRKALLQQMKTSA